MKVFAVIYVNSMLFASSFTGNLNFPHCCGTIEYNLISENAFWNLIPAKSFLGADVVTAVDIVNKHCHGMTGSGRQYYKKGHRQCRLIQKILYFQQFRQTFFAMTLPLVEDDLSRDFPGFPLFAKELKLHKFSEPFDPDDDLRGKNCQSRGLERD